MRRRSSAKGHATGLRVAVLYNAGTRERKMLVEIDFLDERKKDCKKKKCCTDFEISHENAA
jgi:hypothetical protein